VSKQKFKYNPKTLSYEEVKLSFGRKVLRVLLWLAPNILVAIILAFFFSRQIETPKERENRAEMERYIREVKRMQKDLELANKALKEIQSRDEQMYRSALHAKAFPEELRIMGTGGSDRYAHLSDLPDAELLTQTAQQLDQLERSIYAQSLSFNELANLVRQKEKMLTSIPAIQPVHNKELKRPIGGFGMRIDPIYRTRMMHAGVDFTADRGTEVYATGDGVVEVVESKRWGYGKSIVINHGFGYKTLYAHLSKFEVKQGQKVKRGELIGLIGSTGKSTGPHLHYEVIKDGVKVNPIGYFHADLTPEQYEEMLEMSENSNEAMD
jgi:murein DD-endopeptidase MepM/ murein hydrolase activator NlpD